MDSTELVNKLGPGLITGAADDDPSGIATYSQAGAQFRFGLVWTLFLTTPLMISIQMLSAQIGWVTGNGLATNIQKLFPRWITICLVSLLVIANTINIAADIAAMGEAAKLVIGGPSALYIAVFGVACISAQVLFNYEKSVRVLKWLTLTLFAYVAVILAVQVPWTQVAMESTRPWLFVESGTTLKNYTAMVVAVLGTTISPYLFFWQASQEVEDMKLHHQVSLLDGNDAVAKTELKRIQWDTWAGMFYSNLTAYFIILATAVTLHAAGITDINNAAQAASALKPIAGNFTFILFAIGILGVGLIGVPVLAGSAAYAMAEVFNWRSSLEDTALEAKRFYAVIALSVLMALVIQYSPITPMKALFWSAVINGVVAVPLMIVILLLSAKTSVMGKFVASKIILILGWVATIVMGIAALWMFL
jgi:NRAMP (natural resistance-associated macrophage protein)-like metal ion transporter